MPCHRVQGLRRIADGDRARRAARLRVQTQRVGQARRRVGKASQAAAEGGAQARQEGRVVQRQQLFCARGRHAPYQRVAVVLRQQGQRAFVGEAFIGAVGDGSAATHMGNDGALAIIAADGAFRLLAEQAALGLHQQAGAQARCGARLVDLHGHAIAVLAAARHQGRAQAGHAQALAHVGQRADDGAVTGHITERLDAMLAAVHQAAPELAASRNVNLMNRGRCHGPGARFFENLAAAVRQGDGARVAPGLFERFGVEQGDAGGAAAPLHQQGGQRHADGAGAADGEIESGRCMHAAALIL